MTTWRELLRATDRADDERRLVILSPRPGVPPVATTLWRDEDWRQWEESCERSTQIKVGAEQDGYRVTMI